MPSTFRRVRPGRLLRGGGPTFSNATTARELAADWDLKTLLDLRSTSGIERDGAALEFSRAGVQVRSCPLTGYDRARSTLILH